MALDTLINNSLAKRVRSNGMAFVDDHPILSALIAVLVAIFIVPIAIFAGSVVLFISISVGIALLVVAPVTVIPAVTIGTILWAGYKVIRWTLSFVFRGTVGSDNTVMMRPQASAMGNEAHGNLDINLVKVESKEGGKPDQVA